MDFTQFSWQKGNLISLRPTTIEDMDDYERWNNPNCKASEYDGPWYKNDNLSKLIEIRKKKVEKGLKTPYRFLEIYTSTGEHIGWVNAYHSENDPHATAVGITIQEDQYWGRGIGTQLSNSVDRQYHKYAQLLPATDLSR